MRSKANGAPVFFLHNAHLSILVANIPSLYAHTSSILLSNATLPYTLEIANKGVKQALKDNKYLRAGLSFWDGKATLKECCDVNGYEWHNPDELVKTF